MSKVSSVVDCNPLRHQHSIFAIFMSLAGFFFFFKTLVSFFFKIKYYPWFWTCHLAFGRQRHSLSYLFSSLTGLGQLEIVWRRELFFQCVEPVSRMWLLPSSS